MPLAFGNDRARRVPARVGLLVPSASGGRAGQDDASDEAWRGVLERELAAVQVTDGRHDGRAEAVSGKAAAPIRTVEARDDLGFLLGWDTGAPVLNHDRHGLSVFSRPDAHGGRVAAAVLERIVDQIGRRAREEVLVAERR